MKKYFVSQINVESGWQKFFSKGWGDIACRHDLKRIKDKKLKGFLPMWDRNVGKFAWFSIISKTANRNGYIVTRRSIPEFWKNCFEEISQNKQTK